MLGYDCDPHIHCLVFENYVTRHGKALLSKCEVFSHYYGLVFVFVFLDQYVHNFCCCCSVLICPHFDPIVGVC